MNFDKSSRSELTDDTLIYRRPHFRLEGNDLFFFLSERPFRHLNPTEAETWNELKRGPVSISLLQHAGTVQSMLQAGVLEAIAPIPEVNRRQILVIEPHCDDAALSIGATMWKMRHEVEFHLLTLASKSNYTTAFHLNRDYFNRLQTTAMRTSEGELFTAHLGGHYYCAGLPEATLRYDDSDWDLTFFDAHKVSTAIFTNRRASAPTLNLWTNSVKEFLRGREFEEIWLPLGAGNHSDHDLARNAGLRVLMEQEAPVVVRLYEDVPYGAQYPDHTARILRTIEEAGTTLVPWWQNVTAEFAAKLSLLNIFASQFKVPRIQAGVERSASASDTADAIERLWTVRTLPCHLADDQLWIGAPDAAKARRKLAKFLKNSASEKRVAIFAINALGRWSEDLPLVSDAFRAAKFVVYANARVCAEIRAVEDPRVELHCLNSRRSSWLKAALREVFTGHRIVIAGDDLGKAKRLSSIWLTGRTIICSAMDHFIQALASS